MGFWLFLFVVVLFFKNILLAIELKSEPVVTNRCEFKKQILEYEIIHVFHNIHILLRCPARLSQVFQPPCVKVWRTGHVR